MNYGVYVCAAYGTGNYGIAWVTHASLAVKMASADVERAKVGVIFLNFPPILHYT